MSKKMSKYEQMILIIEDYIFDLTEPQRTWETKWFKEVSYQRWAGNELLNRVRRNPSKDPIEIVSDFAAQTREYSMKDHDDKRDRQIFDTAYKLAKDILEITRCMR